MKTCSKCGKTYEDDNLNFCLEDGEALSFAARSAPTVRMPQANETTQWQNPVQQTAPRSSSKTVIWVLVILGLLFLLCGGGVVGGLLLLRNSQPTIFTETPDFPSLKPSASPFVSSTPLASEKSAGYLTLENYNRLKIGMDRSEVEGILGGEGTELSDYSAAGMRFSVIKWEGDNFKSIVVTFKNDKIMSKTQVLLDK